MAWITRPGLPGKIYVPAEDARQPRKHPCSGCFSCQWCEDTRCQVCRGEPSATDPSPRPGE